MNPKTIIPVITATVILATTGCIHAQDESDICSRIKDFKSDRNIPVLEPMTEQEFNDPAHQNKANLLMASEYISYERCGDKAIFRFPLDGIKDMPLSDTPLQGMSITVNGKEQHAYAIDTKRQKTVIPPVNGYFATMVEENGDDGTTYEVRSFHILGTRKTTCLVDGKETGAYEILVMPSKESLDFSGLFE